MPHQTVVKALPCLDIRVLEIPARLRLVLVLTSSRVMVRWLLLRSSSSAMQVRIDPKPYGRGSGRRHPKPAPHCRRQVTRGNGDRAITNYCAI